MGPIRAPTQEFKITRENKFQLLTEDEVNVDLLNRNITTILTESAVAVGEVELRKEPGKLRKQTKDLIAKSQNMKLSHTVDQIELAQLSKLINRIKTVDISAYNMAIIEETVNNRGSLKATKKKLPIGTNRTYALRDEHANITHSMDEILKVAERFYNRLYASNVMPEDTTEPISFACEVPLIIKEENGAALKGMKRGKAAGEDGKPWIF